MATKDTYSHDPLTKQTISSCEEMSVYAHRIIYIHMCMHWGGCSYEYIQMPVFAEMYTCVCLYARLKIDGLVWDCGISSALAMEMLRFCTRPSMCLCVLARNAGACPHTCMQMPKGIKAITDQIYQTRSPSGPSRWRLVFGTGGHSILSMSFKNTSTQL